MSYSEANTTTAKRSHAVPPYINVTPLIDVLLVLLIIFMVITPVKPTRFQAQVPDEPNRDVPLEANPHTLVVSISRDATVKINEGMDAGTVFDTQPLAAQLTRIFAERRVNNIFREDAAMRIDLPFDERLERKVFIKAPRSIDYGIVVKVIDAAKGAGARPIGLQIDDLLD